jgi:hypothetical protein
MKKIKTKEEFEEIIKQYKTGDLILNGPSHHYKGIITDINSAKIHKDLCAITVKCKKVIYQDIKIRNMVLYLYQNWGQEYYAKVIERAQSKTYEIY